MSTLPNLHPRRSEKDKDGGQEEEEAEDISVDHEGCLNRVWNTCSINKPPGKDLDNLAVSMEMPFSLDLPYYPY